MIMKYCTCLAFLLFISSYAFAQTKIPPHQWNVTLKIVDENGNPVSGANTRVGYFVNSQPASFAGLTDTNGIFTASHSAASDLNELGFEANKSGFYATRMVHMLYPPYDPVKWDITQTLVLKTIGKPTAMYAKQLNTRVPALDVPVGFDLMVGDWIAPYGKGINSDINFTGHFDKFNDGESDFTLTVSFPKVGDGIQEFTVPDAQKGSDLRSLHEAPTNNYQPQWVQIDKRRPGKSIETNRDLNRNYVFRVRSVVDSNGNMISTHYGKIYGDFMKFDYYLNPTPNDRSIEFDPKQNLLGGLKPFEQVTAP
jgi:hypothetical protein